MIQATYHYPHGFLWGTATSSHQVEGGNTNNNWYAWEQENGRILHGHKSGKACDWWGGRWREDLDRAAESGQNAHRLSIEWSRVQPAPDRWDEEALDYYREIIRGMRERSLAPMVTLHHFTDPLWLAETGGWKDRGVAERFGKYASKVVEALQEYVELWVTINEPNVFAVSGYLFGEFPPGERSLPTTLQVEANMLRAHAAAYRAIHLVQPQAKVGLAHHYRGIRPASAWSPLDRWVAGMQSSSFNESLSRALVDGRMRLPVAGWVQVPEAKGTQDYFGLNYYTRELAAFDPLRPGELFARRYYDPEATLSDNSFLAHDPEGFYQALKWAYGFGLPIYVTENGVEDADDHLRPRYLAEHLHQLWKAANFNWGIQAYFHWTLVDNFEWERGWTQRFGLWELDENSQARRKRTSADFYAAVCRENGLSSEDVAEFAPAAFETVFPTGGADG